MSDENSKITPEQVRQLARLARLDINDHEIDLFRQQLSEVIDYNMSLLSQVDVSQVQPTAQTTGLQNVWRDDEVAASLPVEAVKGQAPRWHDDRFVVPAVMDD